MTRGCRFVLCVIAAVSVAALTACNRDKSDPLTAQQTAVPTVPATAVTAVIGTPTPESTPTPEPTATGTPAPATPTVEPRVENGLQIIDETWVGVVRESGGLRIRSAPRVASDNVVGSVPQNAEVNVSGRVLNGEEAETGKGTTWLIVGLDQYLYAAPGYVERVQ